jgi:hypothetical protein
MTEPFTENKIMTEFTVDEEIWVQSQRFTAFGGNHHKVMVLGLNILRYGVLPLTLIALILVMQNDPRVTSANVRNYFTVLVVYLAMLSYQLYLWFFGYRNAYITHPNLANVRLSYQFTREFFLFKTTAEKTETTYTIPYNSLKSAYENADFLFLTSKKRIKFVILKKAMDESSMNHVREWLQKAMDKRYYIVK